MAIKFQIRRDTSNNWSNVNPILASGEFGFETTSNRLKIGNGSNTWNTLPYVESGNSFIGTGVIFNSNVSNSAAISATKLSFTQNGTNAITRTVDVKLKEVVSVLDFGAVGDGIANDTQAFSDAVATGQPIYVPKANNFYNLTTLSASQQKMLFGPGFVQINANIARDGASQISSTPFVNSNTSQLRIINRDCQPAQWPGIEGSIYGSGIFAQVRRTGGWPSYGGCYYGEYYVSSNINDNQYEFGITQFVNCANLTNGRIFGSWFGSNSPASNTYSNNTLVHTYTAGGPIGMEINVGNRWAEFGLLDDIGSTRETVGLQIVPDVVPSSDHSPSFPSSGGNTPVYNGSFGLVLGRSIHAHRWQTGIHYRENTITPNGRAINIMGASTAANAYGALFRATANTKRGIDFSSATITEQAMLLGNSQNIQWAGGASFNGDSAGSFGLSTFGSGGFGILYANNYSSQCIQWGHSSGSPTLGFFGATRITRPTAVANTTATSNTVSDVTDIATKLNQLLDRLRSLGLIAP